MMEFTNCRDCPWMIVAGTPETAEAKLKHLIWNPDHTLHVEDTLKAHLRRWDIY